MVGGGVLSCVLSSVRLVSILHTPTVRYIFLDMFSFPYDTSPIPYMCCPYNLSHMTHCLLIDNVLLTDCVVQHRVQHTRDVSHLVEGRSL